MDAFKSPKGEIIWEQFYSGGKLMYVVTSKPARDTYYLYRNESGVLRKIGKAKSPVDLREKMEGL